MTRTFQASGMWENINQLWVTESAAADLTNFKSDKRNYNLAVWDPATNGVRYLKALLFHLAMDLSADEWAKIKRIPRREVGNPVTVRCLGETVCIDYLQTAIELGFFERHVDLDGAAVLEIGAGYGRSCHAMLSNYDISRYCIVDLPNTLSLSRRYLREVLDDAQFAKIRFVQVDDVGDALESMRFDLCVNIHSFEEMNPETVRAYLDLIAEKCTAFYVKNAVGKYTDKSMDGHAKGTDAVQLAMEAGLLKKVIDIHDDEAVQAVAPDFVSAYRPAENWTCVADGRGVPWSYFWQAVYTTGRR